MNLSKKTRQKLWQCQGALIILEYPKKPTFNEIIFTAVQNYYDLIKDEADEKAFQTLGFQVRKVEG